MPTLCKLASTYATNPSEPPPEAGLFWALGLFFFIGSVLAIVFGEKEFRQAFIIGVCAPGIITNMMSGVQEGNANRARERISYLFTVSEAFAQPPHLEVIEAKDSRTIYIEMSQIEQHQKSQKIQFSIDIEAYGPGNNILLRSSLPVIPGAIQTSIPKQTKTLVIKAMGTEKTVHIDSTQNDSGFLQLDFKTSTNDFLWGLGFTRGIKLDQINSTYMPIDSTTDLIKNGIKSVTETKLTNYTITDANYKLALENIDKFNQTSNPEVRKLIEEQIFQSWHNINQQLTPYSPKYVKIKKNLNEIKAKADEAGITALTNKE
ncbi:hypothetical protein [Desulfovibrio ferrophilus]|nr:hypothetical protein [Desulfovibrio ferrophilus]